MKKFFVKLSVGILMAIICLTLMTVLQHFTKDYEEQFEGLEQTKVSIVFKDHTRYIGLEEANQFINLKPLDDYQSMIISENRLIEIIEADGKKFIKDSEFKKELSSDYLYITTKNKVVKLDGLEYKTWLQLEIRNTLIISSGIIVCLGLFFGVMFEVEERLKKTKKKALN